MQWHDNYTHMLHTLRHTMSYKDSTMLYVGSVLINDCVYIPILTFGCNPTLGQHSFGL